MESPSTSPEVLLSRGSGFPLVCHFYRQRVQSSECIVRVAMRVAQCSQPGLRWSPALSVSSFTRTPLSSGEWGASAGVLHLQETGCESEVIRHERSALGGLGCRLRGSPRSSDPCELIWAGGGREGLLRPEVEPRPGRRIQKELGSDWWDTEPQDFAKGCAESCCCGAWSVPESFVL